MEEKDNAGGRPEFEPTEIDRAWVERASLVGLSQDLIRQQVINPQTDEPISLKTLRKHFRQILDFGLCELGVELMTTAKEIATDAEHDKCVQMNIWMQKTRLGMKETTVNEIVGADGGAFEVPQLVITLGNHESQSGSE